MHARMYACACMFACVHVCVCVWWGYYVACAMQGFHHAHDCALGTKHLYGFSHTLDDARLWNFTSIKYAEYFFNGVSPTHIRVFSIAYDVCYGNISDHAHIM